MTLTQNREVTSSRAAGPQSGPGLSLLDTADFLSHRVSHFSSELDN